MNKELHLAEVPDANTAILVKKGSKNCVIKQYFPLIIRSW